MENKKIWYQAESTTFDNGKTKISGFRGVAQQLSAAENKAEEAYK